MLAIVSTILFSVSTFAQKKDTCCPCISQPKPVKKVPASPRPWRYVETSGKGLITASFNDSIVIEDHTGLTFIPEVSGGLNQGGRYAPPMSNLKEIKGSFNRYVNVKRFPAPKDYYRHHHHYDWSWLAILFFLGLIALLAYLFSRNQQPVSVTIQNPPPASPNKSPIAVDMEQINKMMQQVPGSKVRVFSNGTVVMEYPDKKGEKQYPAAEVKDKKEEKEKQE